MIEEMTQENMKKKVKLLKKGRSKSMMPDMIRVIEEWRKGWSSPDYFVFDNEGNKTMLREHVDGECPFVKVKDVHV